MQHSAITDTEGIHEPKGCSTASSGQIYVANGSGSGVWTSPVYGELYISGNTTLSFTPPTADITDFAQLATTGWTAGQYSGVTLGTDTITIGTSGTYALNFWCNVVTSAASGTQFAVKYAINGSTNGRSLKVQKNSAGADIITMAASGISSLTSGNVVSIYMASSATTTFKVEDAGFSVIKL